MRPQLLKVSKEPQHSFSVRRDLVPYVNNRWHYHAEVELIHFKKGEGTQFIGDSIKQFKAGDVVIVGSLDTFNSWGLIASKFSLLSNLYTKRGKSRT